MCLQAVRAGRRVVMITEVGVGDLAERVPAGGGVNCDAPAASWVVVPEA